MLTLIIKGTPEDARRAAREHGVPIRVIKNMLPDWAETIATAEDEHRNRIALNWFCASPQEQEPPYPAGTLLWYGERARAPEAYREAIPTPPPAPLREWTVWFERRDRFKLVVAATDSAAAQELAQSIVDQRGPDVFSTSGGTSAIVTSVVEKDR